MKLSRLIVMVQRWRGTAGKEGIATSAKINRRERKRRHSTLASEDRCFNDSFEIVDNW